MLELRQCSLQRPSTTLSQSGPALPLAIAGPMATRFQRGPLGGIVIVATITAALGYALAYVIPWSANWRRGAVRVWLRRRVGGTARSDRCFERGLWEAAQIAPTCARSGLPESEIKSSGISDRIPEESVIGPHRNR